MDKSNKRLLRKSKRFFHKSKLQGFRQQGFRKPKQGFRRRFSPIRPGDQIDYRNLSLIGQFISYQGKILSRRMTKLTLKQQRLVAVSVKQARVLSILPFVYNERVLKRIKSMIRNKYARKTTRKYPTWRDKKNLPPKVETQYPTRKEKKYLPPKVETQYPTWRDKKNLPPKVETQYPTWRDKKNLPPKVENEYPPGGDKKNAPRTGNK